MSAQAKALEAKGSYAEARELWSRSLNLLPPDAKQAEWITERLRVLEQRQNQLPDPTKKPDHAWARKFGPLTPFLILLAKSKGLLLALFKLKFLFSFASFLYIYVLLFGWRYGLGISLCLLIHEMGHFIDIKRRGLPAEMPVFLPGLGAYVKWQAIGVTKREIAQISLAGPLAGWIAAACCYLLYTHTGNPLWAALARTGAVLNILNLIPVWILDGSKAMDALGKVERAALLAITLLCWIYTREGIFFLVSAGITWRLFAKDKPVKEDWGSWLYFVAVLVALAVVLHYTPELRTR